MAFHVYALLALETFADETAALLAEQRWIKQLHATDQLLNSIVVLAEAIPEPEYLGFGARCRQRRRSIGLSQQRAAALFGILPSRLCRIESESARAVTAETAVRIARALDCSVEWLVTGADRQEAQAAE